MLPFRSTIVPSNATREKANTNRARSWWKVIVAILQANENQMEFGLLKNKIRFKW
jgi:hypothetical protein